MPSLLLQKPSSRSKSKEHSIVLSRRLEDWKRGDVDTLIKEARHIQKKFTTSRQSRTFEDVSHIFAKLVMEGKLSAAMKFLDKENSTGVHTLSDEVLDELKEKHPQPASVLEQCLLYGPIKNIPAYYFDDIDEQTVLNAALNTKGSAGPSEMDSELYRRILCSKSFCAVGKELREQIATFAKNLATKLYDHKFLESYVASRLIPLDKNPGIRPIGVGEVLCRIVGKILTRQINSDIKEAAGPLQTCAGHSAGSEAAIHAIRTVFEMEGTDAVLLIDTRNAFNCMNRKVALHNIQIQNHLLI